MSRVVNFNLGVNLGWLQQGAGFGGRPIPEMTADLERVRGSAATAGYTGYQALIDNARRALSSGQPPGSVLDEISNLIRLFQGQAHGIDSEALNLGIVLGWLQQGARADNRPISMATADLESARTHALNAQYKNYDNYINNALAKLLSGQRLSSILLVEINPLIDLLQAEG